MAESGISARARLAAVRDVLRRHQLPMAERIDLVLQGSDAQVQAFLLSTELWGRTGSIVYRAGLAQSWEAQRDSEDAFHQLGEWQIAHGYSNPDVMDWVGFFRSRRSLPQLAGGVPPSVSDRPIRQAVPWSARDVWLGVIAAALIVGATYAVLYAVAISSLRPDVDLWVAVVPTLVEVLTLIPVWWFAIRRKPGSLRSLGFVAFRFRIVAVGIGLLVASYWFDGLYAAVLQHFGLEVQADMLPIAQRLSTPWPLIISVVFVAPVVEETFFRGFVFGGLRARYDWRWAAAISAAVFAAAHLQITFFIPAFILGYLLAYLFQRSNSIWPGMIVHGVMNAFAMVVLYVRL